MSVSVFRATVSRSLPAVRRAPLAIARRAYIKPSKPVLDDDPKTRAAYDELRVEVDPKFATVDESLTFEHPKTFPKEDLGHDVQGPGHGRHKKRTLASLSMDGKVCAVTGGARGLGNMMARTFVESGADAIVIIDLKQEDAEHAAKELVDWFVEHGEASPGEIKAIGLGCDVSDEASVKAAFATIKKEFGRLDAMITAAGIVENFVAHEYPTPKVKKLLDINVMGTWYCALEASKLMPEGGAITMIGSMSGQVVNVPQPQTPYNFSKAAVRHMARSLAVEWAKQGIRVNCISPGYTLTNLTKVILDANPVLRDEWVHRTPVGRLADPSDLKGAVIYFSSDSSKFTTGAELVIDGGYTCL
ncbi:putative d-arabinitol 2-dehydrogenase [Naematelia encephala]|uniref:Putative d-arabinitol 2-dehydrogenase n=1 Tax=Naematelia encephala TaxID=71784 RepID=A0A1Y2APZ6_9TREE|nr:putative d-arabinitol 2-dehydrogenase [Naematelia encephala]